MDNEYRKISIEELRPGIFIGDVFSESGRLLFSADKKVEDYHQIESLRRRGVSYVFAPQKKTHPSKKTQTQLRDLPKPEISVQAYRKELAAVHALKIKTITIVKKLMQSAKTGSFSTIANIKGDLEGVILTALSNIDHFMALKVITENERLYNHCVNVAILMAGLAQSIGYPENKVLDVAISGLLHDIGKIRLPQELLLKDAMYTMQEMVIIRKHPKLGADLAKRVIRNIPASCISVIAQHHERINGTGYPNQLNRDQICMPAIICSIANVYDNFTTESSIKKAFLPQEALALIFQGADEEYPRALVEHFTRLLGIYPVGSFVQLESGEMGVVTKINRESLLTPQVMLFFNTSEQRIEKPFIRDLFTSTKSADNNPKRRIVKSLNPSSYGFNTLEIMRSGGELV